MIRFISVLLFALTLGTAQAQTTVGWLTNATGLASLPPTSSRQAVSVGNESSGWSQWNWNAASTASTNSTVVAYTGLATGRWIQSPITGVAFGLTTATVPTSSNSVVNKTALDASAALALAKASNLSDLASSATARTNLGLGTLATQSGTFSGTSSGVNTGDQTTITGNAGTATALATARAINGVAFDGTAPITVTAAAGTLTGATLASGVTGSSLTSAAAGAFGSAAFISAASKLSTTNGVAVNLSATVFNSYEVNVLAYGAVGDGVTDNTVAFNLAIDAAASIGGNIRVPAGVFITGPLTLKTNVFGLTGANPNAEKFTNQAVSILKLKANSTTNLLAWQTGSSASLQNIFLDGNKANQTNTASVLRTGYESGARSEIQISNVGVANGAGAGIEVNRNEVNFYNVVAFQNSGTGFWFNGGDSASYGSGDCALVNCQAGFNGGDGFLFDTYFAGAQRIVNLDSYLNQGDGIEFRGITSGLNLITISQAMINQNFGHGIHINGAVNSFTVSDATIYGSNYNDNGYGTTNSSPSGTFSDIYIAPSSGVFSSVLLLNNNRIGISYGGNTTRIPKYGFEDARTNSYYNGLGIVLSGNGFATSATNNFSTGLVLSTNTYLNGIIVGNTVYNGTQFANYLSGSSMAVGALSVSNTITITADGMTNNILVYEYAPGGLAFRTGPPSAYKYWTLGSDGVTGAPGPMDVNGAGTYQGNLTIQSQLLMTNATLGKVLLYQAPGGGFTVAVDYGGTPKFFQFNGTNGSFAAPGDAVISGNLAIKDQILITNTLGSVLGYVYTNGSFGIVANYGGTQKFFLFSGSDGSFTSPGKITGTVLESTVASGTSPIVIASTTLVTNLNAQFVNGVAGSGYQPANQYLTNLASAGTTGSGAFVRATGPTLSGPTTDTVTLVTSGFTNNAQIYQHQAGGIAIRTGPPSAYKYATIGSDGSVSLPVSLAVNGAGNFQGTLGIQSQLLLTNASLGGVLLYQSSGGGFNIAANYLGSAKYFQFSGVDGSFIAQGPVTGTTLTSTVATGTAPLTVASTTLVSNLNADRLDGLHKGGIQPANANLTNVAALTVQSLPSTIISVTENTQTGTTYTVLSTDNGKVVTLNNAAAITVTVPTLSAGFSCTFIQKGAGQVTFSASGTTVSNAHSQTKTFGQYAAVTLYGLSSTTFVLAGDTGT